MGVSDLIEIMFKVAEAVAGGCPCRVDITLMGAPGEVLDMIGNRGKDTAMRSNPARTVSIFATENTAASGAKKEAA